jgi:hypothetical protein
MTSQDNVPYADLEPMSDVVEECRCVEAECAAHGVNLHPEHHDGNSPHAAPVVIGETTSHIVDGYPDYGS